jgi:hypothetical protein
VLLPPVAGYQEVVTLDQWLAVQFQEAVLGPLAAGPRAMFVAAVAALAVAVRERRRS